MSTASTNAIDVPESADFQLEIAADHPCLAGHFPDQPVVPAVVLLDNTLRLARERWPDLAAAGHVRGLSQAKFVGMVLPGQPLQIRVERTATALRFSISRGDDLVCRGAWQIAQAETAQV